MGHLAAPALAGTAEAAVVEGALDGVAAAAADEAATPDDVGPASCPLPPDPQAHSPKNPARTANERTARERFTTCT